MKSAHVINEDEDELLQYKDEVAGFPSSVTVVCYQNVPAVELLTRRVHLLTFILFLIKIMYILMQNAGHVIPKRI